MLRACLLISLALSPARAQTAPAAVSHHLSLDQAYQLALKWSETLAQRGETVAQLQARIDEMRSYLLPRFAFSGTEVVQHTPNQPGALSSAFDQKTREQGQFTMHQTLFTGLRDYLALRQAKEQSASADFALLRARQLLYQDVAQAFLNLLSVRHQLDIQQAILRTTEDRIKELLQRERLGRSRRSEVLAAQSQRAQTVAQLEINRRDLAVAQLQLRFLTGLQEDVEPVEVPAPATEPLEPLLAAAARRPDVEGARRDRDAAALGVPIVARQRWPLVNLDGDYYVFRPPPQDQVKWDVTLSFSLPLYEGGQIRAQTRQAEAQRRSAEAALTQALRQADLDVRRAHRNLQSSLAIVVALVEAVRLAEENSHAQSADYRAGLVTNLDVLGSINALEIVQLALDGARLTAVFAQAQLAVASGRVGVQP